MPRIKAAPKKFIKSGVQSPTNNWLFLLKGEALELSEQYTGSGTPDIVTLRHPNTGDPAIFLFSPANNSVQEVLTFSDGKRSWFFDDNVKSDGKLHLSTPIDPIFLVLPYLRKHTSTHAVPLDQLLMDDDFPETQRLLKSSGLKYLNLIADKKSEELNAFKFNEEKTLVWLKKKTERVADILKQKNIHVGGGGAVSATFVRAGEQAADADAYLRYAAGIVSEYLLDDLSAKLYAFLGLPDEATVLKRKSMPGGEPESKKAKKSREEENCNASSNVLDLSKPPPTTTPLLLLPPSSTAAKTVASAKDKARVKAASGSKSITSFFKKI